MTWNLLLSLKPAVTQYSFSNFKFLSWRFRLYFFRWMVSEIVRVVWVFHKSDLKLVDIRIMTIHTTLTRSWCARKLVHWDTLHCSKWWQIYLEKHWQELSMTSYLRQAGYELFLKLKNLDQKRYCNGQTLANGWENVPAFSTAITGGILFLFNCLKSSAFEFYFPGKNFDLTFVAHKRFRAALRALQVSSWNAFGNLWVKITFIV